MLETVTLGVRAGTRYGMKLVECVPNFSEGRDRKVIDAIAAAVESVKGVKLLNVDPGADTNRTVYTFVGPLEVIAEAAFLAIECGARLIDMSKHKGAHPRQGACDVCPFVPLSGTTMEECVELARGLGPRVGERLGIPVYLYEYAATRPERKALSDIRKGEYEALAEKLRDPSFRPDFGPAVFNARAGATVVGARDFLIAYNINLNTRNPKIAKDIALAIRETGRPARSGDGRKVKDAHGNEVREAGRFQHCKATGWYIAEYRCAQVTMNLTRYRETPVHVVFDEVCRLAEERGVRVTGSEIVGLVPVEVLRMAGEHYLARQKAPRGVPEADLVEVAVQSLGLSDVQAFVPEKKIIEMMVQAGRDPLMSLTAKGFADECSRDSPAPGGGSVAALCGSLSAALSSMVAALSFAKKGYEKVRDEMEELGREAQSLKEFFVRAVDADTDAFNRVMDAMRLPKGTDEEKRARKDALAAATRGAVLVPLSVLDKALAAARLAGVVAARGNASSLSDAGVAALCAQLAATGAFYNVLINLPGLEDRAFIEETRARAAGLLAEVREECARVEADVTARLEAALAPKKE